MSKIDIRIKQLTVYRDSMYSKIVLIWESCLLHLWRLEDRCDLSRSESYSKLSATFYSVRETGLHKPIELKIFWLPLVAVCHVLMIYYSNKATRIMGVGVLSAEECATRQLILRARGRYNEAESLIRKGLTKDPNACTRGHLRVGLAAVFFREGKYPDARKQVRFALHEVDEVLDSRKFSDAIMIWRGCANAMEQAPIRDRNSAFGDLPKPDRIRKIARDLSLEWGMRDEYLKSL